MLLPCYVWMAGIVMDIEACGGKVKDGLSGEMPEQA